MATISQLMQGRVPGEIKIRVNNWGESSYFVPYFQAKDYWWSGLSFTGHEAKYNGDSPRWELYLEPKRKVALYLWATAFPLGDRQHICQSVEYYATEEEVRKANPGAVWCQRLDYTKIEVEEG